MIDGKPHQKTFTGSDAEMAALASGWRDAEEEVSGSRHR